MVGVWSTLTQSLRTWYREGGARVQDLFDVILFLSTADD